MVPPSITALYLFFTFTPSEVQSLAGVPTQLEPDLTSLSPTCWRQVSFRRSMVPRSPKWTALHTGLKHWGKTGQSTLGRGGVWPKLKPCEQGRREIQFSFPPSINVLPNTSYSQLSYAKFLLSGGKGSQERLLPTQGCGALWCEHYRWGWPTGASRGH